MQRYLVWVNGLPLLLDSHDQANEETINAALRRMGRQPLSPEDEINGVSVVWMRGAVTGSVEMKYPEKRRT